jgi:predicted DNA-binding mobile mystery protein A
MGIEAIVLKQYRDKVDQAVIRFGGYFMPVSEGWLKTVRKALGMSGAQLAKRLGVTKGRISQAESGELSGGVTLRTMHAMAQAMDCRFVYAIVPEKDIESIISEQAVIKAKARVKAASTHMALESQSLDKQALDSEIERIASEILSKMPSDFWSEK